MERIHRQRLKCLLETVENALKVQNEYINDPNYEERKTYLENLKANLENMKEGFQRFIELMDGKKSPTVGVFGCPSRGKSTLLNVLLGVNILPMGGKVGTTRFGTELTYKNPKDKEEPYEVTVSYKSKPPELNSYNERDAYNQLGFLARDADNRDPDIIKIKIDGPFKSFIGNDIVFVDTPGVELGASKEDLSKDEIIVEDNFEGDKERALAILSTVDVVIYCMTLRYAERMDKVFYKNLIKNKFKPINVITGCDERGENETNEYFKNAMMKDYELVEGQTVVVSSTKALDIIKDAINKNKNMAELKFEGEDLKEFNELREKIRKRIGDKSSHFCEGRIARFEEFYDCIKKDANDRNIKLPDLKKPFLLPKYLEKPLEKIGDLTKKVKG